MPAQTPSGWRMVSQSMPRARFSSDSPISSDGTPQANSTISMPRFTSPRDSTTVLPCSRVVLRTRSSKFSSSSVLNLKKTRARSTAGVSIQPGNAARGGFDGLVDVRRCAQRRFGNDFAGGRIVNRRRGNVFYFAPFAAKPDRTRFKSFGHIKKHRASSTNIQRSSASKLQIPSTKLQRNSKHQHPNNDARHSFWSLCVWCFSGAWMLVLGASSHRDSASDCFTNSSPRHSPSALTTLVAAAAFCAALRSAWRFTRSACVVK